jgi:ABC-type polysaccharide/polyol phosphate export permease
LLRVPGCACRREPIPAERLDIVPGLPSMHAPPPALRPLVTTASQDIVRGAGNVQLWASLGWRDVRLRYRRTVIGPFWATINLAIYVLGVGAVGAGLWNEPLATYLPYLVSGMIVWLLMSTIVNESCGLFLSGAVLLREVSFDYSILAYALVWRNFIVFLHHLVVYVGVCVIFAPAVLGWNMLLAVPGLLIVLANGVWVALLCGMVCLRFRDVQQLISNFTQIALFVTPIFWPPTSLKGPAQRLFVELNPLFHMIDIVRSPMLGRSPALASELTAIAITALGWGLTLVFFHRFRKRIAYWS